MQQMATTPYPAEMIAKPFFAQTQTLFKCVRDHDFDTLAALCDDDFGIVDIDPSGGNVPISTRQEWEDWFRTLFFQLDAMQATTDTEIMKYDALAHDTLGYGVVDFCQFLSLQGHTAKFFCQVTIIWKKVGDEWKESRWHCSVLDTEIPEALRHLIPE